MKTLTIEQQRSRMTEILNETVEFYSSDPVGRRGMKDNGQCLYKITKENGDVCKCAVGRYMLDDISEEIYDKIENFDGSHESVTSLLKEEYKGLNKTFWKALQLIHDLDGFWNSRGITTVGKSEYYSLENSIKDGCHDINN